MASKVSWYDEALEVRGLAQIMKNRVVPILLLMLCIYICRFINFANVQKCVILHNKQIHIRPKQIVFFILKCFIYHGFSLKKSLF